MSKGPISIPPSTEVDDRDPDVEAYLQALSDWDAALKWAHKGDFDPLAECLRWQELPLVSAAVREWLAQGLLNGFKKPRKVTKRPQRIFFEDAQGRQFWLDKRYVVIFEARRHFQQLRASKMKRERAINETMAVYGERLDTVARTSRPSRTKQVVGKKIGQSSKAKLTGRELLVDALARPLSRWGVALSSKTADEMFGDILKKPFETSQPR